MTWVLGKGLRNRREGRHGKTEKDQGNTVSPRATPSVFGGELTWRFENRLNGVCGLHLKRFRQRTSTRQQPLDGGYEDRRLALSLSVDDPRPYVSGRSWR